MALPLSYHDLNLIIFLSQADPHASSLRRVDVHGGEHVARDAVHRPPGLDADAYQVEFEEYDAHAHHEEQLLPIFVSLSPTGTSLTMHTCATFHSTRCEIINIINSQPPENLYDDHHCFHD